MGDIGNEWSVPLVDGFEEADLRSGLKAGGAILGAFIVERPAKPECVVYIRSDWIRGRGFRIVRTWRNLEGDRVFKSFDTAVRFIRKYYAGRFMVYPQGDRELSDFAGVVHEDLPTGSSLGADPDLAACGREAG